MASQSVIIPSLYIARVHHSITQEFIHSVFCQLFGYSVNDGSCLERIDVIERVDRNNGQLFYVTFLHFLPVYTTPLIQEFIEKINNDDTALIHYGNRWFWKVQRNKKVLPRQKIPRIEYGPQKRLGKEEEIKIYNIQKEKMGNHSHSSSHSHSSLQYEESKYDNESYVTEEVKQYIDTMLMNMNLESNTNKSTNNFNDGLSEFEELGESLEVILDSL